MDFICGEGIYQVTIAPTATKIERDLGKLPGTKRVLVAPAFPKNILAQQNDGVLDVVETEDLVNHFLDWLAGRDENRGVAAYLQGVINVALNEFSRD